MPARILRSFIIVGLILAMLLCLYATIHFHMSLGSSLDQSRVVYDRNLWLVLFLISATASYLVRSFWKSRK